MFLTIALISLSFQCGYIIVVTVTDCCFLQNHDGSNNNSK